MARVLRDVRGSNLTGDQAVVAKARSPFLRKLWGILDDRAYSNVISWTENGRHVVIHDPVAMPGVLGHWFRSCALKSFQRQLNYFGFAKMRQGEREQMEYAHPLFIRDTPAQLLRIKRKFNTGELPAQLLK